MSLRWWKKREPKRFERGVGGYLTSCPRPQGCVISHACHECGAEKGKACS